jgi:membrane-associated phospholipid phosphatase
MHMMFGAFAAVLIIWLYPWSSLVMVPFVAAIAWSRRFLDRHSWPEILLGTLIGTAAGYVAVL